MCFEADGPLIFLVDFEICRPDSHALPLIKVPELVVKHLRKPDLVALVGDSELRGIRVQFENLNYFNVQVEVLVPAVRLLASDAHYFLEQSALG